MWSDFHLFSILAEFTLLHGLNVELHHLKLWSFTQCICFALSAHGCRGKEMSLSRFLGVYYKLPKSDPNAVYLLPNAVYLLQCCFIAANIGWARQCDNSLFP